MNIDLKFLEKLKEEYELSEWLYSKYQLEIQAGEMKELDEYLRQWRMKLNDQLDKISGYNDNHTSL